MKTCGNNLSQEFGKAIGVGLLAGLAGTAAITLSQIIEMRITRRKASEAPIKVAKQVTEVKPATKEAIEKVTQEIHWGYGIAWGVARGLISLTGLKGLPATAAHFTAIWGTAMFMLPAYNAAPKITEQEPKAIAIDGMHHAVYAIAAGLTYDALDRNYRSKRERKLEKLISKLHLKELLEKFQS